MDAIKVRLAPFPKVYILSIWVYILRPSLGGISKCALVESQHRFSFKRGPVKMYTFLGHSVFFSLESLLGLYLLNTLSV